MDEDMKNGMPDIGFSENMAPAVSDFLSFESSFRQLMFLYEAAILQIESRLEILKKEFQFSNDRNPIENVKSRVKSQESILRKLKVRGLDVTFSSMTTNIFDIAGVRVICPFIQDVYFIAKMLLSQKDIQLEEVKDYIKNPKDNGYRSLHLIVLVEVSLSSETRQIPVEIQIRTIAMNFWASTEHQLRYKKDREFTLEDQNKLKECADLMAMADEQMQSIAGRFDYDQW